VRTADLVAFTPAVTWRVAAPAAAVVGLYYAALAGAWGLWRRRRVALGSREPRRLRHLRLGCAGVAAAAAVWILAEPWAALAAHGDGRLHVTFVDVGQGDAAVVQLPHGSTVVVDAGGLGGSASFDVGERVIAPVLRALGVSRLAALVLTHGDADHIGGAPSLLDEFLPLDIWEGIPVPPFEPLATLRGSAFEHRLRWSNVQTNDAVLLGGVSLVVRHPPPADWERQRVRNDDSVVIELRWREVSVVFAGDIGQETEERIAGSFEPSALRVVKVPHHGSLTSSSWDFVRALTPRVAVVSVGRSNNFGHPAPAVLQRYRDIGADVFRTDRDGAVTVDSDGASVDVHTFTGRSLRLTPSPVYHDVTRVTKDKKP
jgi:competence protein ComEC